MARRGVVKAGGRPKPISDEALRATRDALIGVLSDSWGTIGWPLLRAQSRQDLRAVFGLIDDPQHALLLAPFLRATDVAASIRDVRLTRIGLQQIDDQHAALMEAQLHRQEAVRGSQAAVREAESRDPVVPPTEQSILKAEDQRRAESLAEAERELAQVSSRRLVLQTQRSDQEAAVAQDELLKFIKVRKYGHNPRNLASAMAGLPYLGCWQSLRNSGKPPNHVWPSTRWTMFKIIEQCWGDRQDRSSAAFVDRLRNRIVRGLPIERDEGNPDQMRWTHPTRAEMVASIREHAARQLALHWRYLRLAVEETDLVCANSHQVPYLVLETFVRNFSRPRKADEVLRAEMERLTPNRVVTPG